MLSMVLVFGRSFEHTTSRSFAWRAAIEIEGGDREKETCSIEKLTETRLIACDMPDYLGPKGLNWVKQVSSRRNKKKENNKLWKFTHYQDDRSKLKLNN